jgi:hypothetical protein
VSVDIRHFVEVSYVVQSLDYRMLRAFGECGVSVEAGAAYVSWSNLAHCPSDFAFVLAFLQAFSFVMDIFAAAEAELDFDHAAVIKIY